MLTPNESYEVNGVTVCEKIIPDGTVWKDAAKAKAAGFSAGALYKKQKKLSGGTGKVQYITIHNTKDLANVENDGEQYTRATYNENMGSTRVHFYVDEIEAWQNLRAGTGVCANDPKGSAEVGWHAGDGSDADGGNMTSLAIEIIMDDTAVHDARAYDNGARLAAWLLWRHGLQIERLVTHSYWNAKRAGKTNADIDRQCVTYVSGKHWCPYYIFDSQGENGAYTNWKKFKAAVKGYLDALEAIGDSSAAPQNDSVGGTVAGFVDVKASAWYAEAVAWAAENGIVKGVDAAHFAPDRTVTRAELAVMLHRMAKLQT